MKNKPFIFILISIFFLIEPLIKILYFKAITQFDFATIFTNLMARNSIRDVFDFWLVYPLAGILLIKIRKWTYFAFMAILAYIVYNILTYEAYTWPYNSDKPYMYHYVIVAMSIFFFAIFLLPKVREPFFNRRIRWWESKARYQVGINCVLKNDTVIFPSEIINISQTGAFLKDSSYFKIGDKLELEFDFLGQQISLPVEVIHRNTINDRHGYGVRFAFKTFRQSIFMAWLMNKIKHSSKSYVIR